MAQLHTAAMMTTPKHETMTTRNLTIPLCLLLLSISAWGQESPAAADILPARPLNLSIVREKKLLQPAELDASNAAIKRNLEQNTSVERMPYGTGYEARQRSASSSGSGSASGSSGGSQSGSGGGNGRGGGRGR